ncbi:DUF2339 domain-containing protein [Thalassotalea piscium]
MNQEVKALQSELALLKLQFSERVNAVEARLNQLIKQENQQLDQGSHASIEIADYTPDLIETEKPVKQVLSRQSVDVHEKINKPVKTSAPIKPSFITTIFHTILASMFDWFSPVTKMYQSYKARGMLGIFILTIVGIGLTLAGFGYLMQLLIDQLGAGFKSLLMCFAAIIVMAVGIGLKIKTQYGEFATAIVTLGILLSYSTIYFAGSVYGIIPNTAVLLLYLFIALACHGLALWLETKIVASLGVIGIATMPILSNTLQIEPFYYLMSLLFVFASSLTIAYKRNEPWLANMSLAFGIVALEWTIGVESVGISAWIVDCFYLLFFAYITFTLLKNKGSSQKVLQLLAALVGSTVLLFFQTNDIFTTQVSMSFVINTAVTASLAILFYKIRHALTHFLILLSALWAVLAVVSAVSDAYWGIAWAVEGILLIYIGRRYHITSVINQGQFLTVLALIYSWSALALYFPLPALKTVDGWVLSIIILAVISCWQRLINHSDAFDQRTLNKIKPLLQLVEVIWFSILLIASLHVWLGDWTGAVVILLQLALLFRARQCQQASIEVFSAALIIVPLYYLYSGTLMVDSYRFMMLPLFAKLAVISAFVQLWLWSAYYRKYQPDSAIRNIAEAARIVFYLLLPICWLGSAIRRLDENVLMVLWLSPFVALCLATKVKHHLLVKQTKILTIIASLAFIFVAGQLQITYSLMTLTGFIVFYGTAFYFYSKDSTSALNKFICSWALVSLGLSIPIILLFQSESLFLGVMVASIIWISYLAMLNYSDHFKRNETMIILINGALIIGAWWLTSLDAIYVSIPVIFLIAAISQKSVFFKNTALGTSLGLNSDLFLHTIAAITYVVLFSTIVGYRLDLIIAPALAVHGALILFMKDRRIFTVKYSFGLILLGITKLALIDAANALLWQKVMLFMGIGVFILLATFWYQKLVKQASK